MAFSESGRASASESEPDFRVIFPFVFERDFETDLLVPILLFEVEADPTRTTQCEGNTLGGPRKPGNDKDKQDDKNKPKWEPPLPTRVGKKKRKGPSTLQKLPVVYPTTRCRLKLLKLQRIQDYLLLEEEFVQNQEQLRPQEDRYQVDRA
ncbi:26S proteasome subunit P45 [Paramicrosporidium saccamoebae]|uniref:26S proteasome subunit P45 n=1 Tax=Paramicrosporidium saccamoebae TaxID=1246581 RepID=A0A2H9TJK0_9FUNG|nr:26S proteasome subunit P45 [Paramicrosporidium saccamoebae]